MDDLVVAIHQPNLFPWLGYFNKIARSDVFYFLDDVQIQKTGASYTNRVSVLMAGASRYVTAPIKRHSGVWNVNETEFVDPRWIAQAVKTLETAYRRADHFKAERDFVFDLVRHETPSLSEYNIHAIGRLCRALGLKAELRKSSDAGVVATDASQRLVDLVRRADANVYLSGNGAAAYQDAELFKQHGIRVEFIDNSALNYPQSGSPAFVRGLSVLDAIFNIGMAGTARLLNPSVQP